jgi:hypothetical protein
MVRDRATPMQVSLLQWLEHVVGAELAEDAS